MQNQHNIYQDILKEISLMPQFLLEDTLHALQKIRKAHEEKQSRIESILAFAGSWSDIPDDEYEEMQDEMNRTRNNLFDREIDF